MPCYRRGHTTGGPPPSVRSAAGPRPDTTQATTCKTRVPGTHRKGQTGATDITPIIIPTLYINQSLHRLLDRVTPLPCVSACRTVTIQKLIDPAPSALEIDRRRPGGGTAPFARPPPALSGEQPYIAQDARVLRSSSAQRRPVSTTAPSLERCPLVPETFPSFLKETPIVTATSSHALSLPSADENRRAAGILPVAQTVEACTGRSLSLAPTAPKPRVSLTRVSTVCVNYVYGATTAGELSPRAMLPVRQRAPRDCPAAQH